MEDDNINYELLYKIIIRGDAAVGKSNILIILSERIFGKYHKYCRY
jgi:hypothetical protein